MAYAIACLMLLSDVIWPLQLKPTYSTSLDRKSVVLRFLLPISVCLSVSLFTENETRLPSVTLPWYMLKTSLLSAFWPLYSSLGFSIRVLLLSYLATRYIPEPKGLKFSSESDSAAYEWYLCSGSIGNTSLLIPPSPAPVNVIFTVLLSFAAADVMHDT